MYLVLLAIVGIWTTLFLLSTLFTYYLETEGEWLLASYPRRWLVAVALTPLMGTIVIVSLLMLGIFWMLRFTRYHSHNEWVTNREDLHVQLRGSVDFFVIDLPLMIRNGKFY